MRPNCLSTQEITYMEKQFVQKYNTAEEEAERIGVSVRTIRTWQKNRRIPSIRIVAGKGGIIRFNPVATDAALEKFTVGES